MIKGALKPVKLQEFMTQLKLRKEFIV